MDNFLSEMNKFSDLASLVTAAQAAVALGLSFVLGIFAAKTYQSAAKGSSGQQIMMPALALFAPLVTALILVVGSSLVRAVSLAGVLIFARAGLSKDSRDTVYLLLVIIVGIACGISQFMLAVLVTVFACSAALAMAGLGFGQARLEEKQLRIQMPATQGFEAIFNDTLLLHVKSFDLLSTETTGEAGSELLLDFLLRTPRSFSSEKLISDLTKLNDKLKIKIGSGAGRI